MPSATPSHDTPRAHQHAQACQALLKHQLHNPNPAVAMCQVIVRHRSIRLSNAVASPTLLAAEGTSDDDMMVCMCERRRVCMKASQSLRCLACCSLCMSVSLPRNLSTFAHTWCGVSGPTARMSMLTAFASGFTETPSAAGCRSALLLEDPREGGRAGSISPVQLHGSP